MYTGTVQSYDGRKGLGEITPKGGGKDLSVNVKALDRAGLCNLENGQTLEFDIDIDRHARNFTVRFKLT